MKNERTQAEYNCQHNYYSGLNGHTAYQMLIEQVVTASRGYDPIKLTNKQKGYDGLDEFIMKAIIEDEVGYFPKNTIIKKIKEKKPQTLIRIIGKPNNYNVEQSQHPYYNP